MLEGVFGFERCLVETLLSPTSDVSKCASLMAKSRPLIGRLLLTDAQKAQFGVVDEGILPGAANFSPSLRYTSTKKLMELKAQMQTFPGLNLELLSMNWLIESREALCS